MADPTERDPIERWFVPVALGILLVAAAIRLPELALNPFHNDEGVNGFFTTNLVRQGVYHYDPANYHGPSLYYFALLSEILFGLTTEAMRLVTVVFGVVLVGLVFPLRRYLGAVAVLVAGAFLAVSPGAVYISRYFIHESLLVAASLGLVVAVTRYLDRRDAPSIIAAAIAAALLFTTKETGIITVVVLLIAVVVGHYYTALRNPQALPQVALGRPGARPKSVWIDGVEYRQRGGGTAGRPAPFSSSIGSMQGEHLAGAGVIFLVIYVLLYSSFFTNFPQGLIDSLATFVIWTQTGEATQVQPIQQYVVWMIPIEAPILILGFVGGLITATRAPSRLWVVIGLWAAGITIAYSIIQYKTPWIILNMLLPLALLAGLAVSELWRSRQLRLGAPVVLGVAVLYSGYFAVDLNYNRYDDEAYPYVFVHSTRDMLRLIDDIEATADRAGTGRETGVVFVTSDYWPLPWYFRDYQRAGFFGRIVETKEAMIVSNVNQEAELQSTNLGSLITDVDRESTSITVCERQSVVGSAITPRLIPAPPFTIVINGELMLVTELGTPTDDIATCGFSDPAYSTAQVREWTVVRGTDNELTLENDPSSPEIHAKGADVTEPTPPIQAYDRVGTYNLRPGVDLALYVRNDVPQR